mgnify:CR=1 FL=1
MRLSELYEKWSEALQDAKTKEDELNKKYALFDEHIKIVHLSASDKLALIRTTLSECIKNDNGYDYVDHGLFKIVSLLMIVSRMTNIEFERNIEKKDDEEESPKSVSNYDMLTSMGVDDYLWDRDMKEREEYQDFIIAEMDTIKEKNSVAAVLAKKFKTE